MESTGLWDMNGREGCMYTAFKGPSDEDLRRHPS